MAFVWGDHGKVSIVLKLDNGITKGFDHLHIMADQQNTEMFLALYGLDKRDDVPFLAGG